MFTRLKARLNFRITSFKGSYTHLSDSQLESNFRRNMATWKSEKEKFLKMTCEEKRKHYQAKSFVRLDQIPSWEEYYQQYQQRLEELYKSSPLIEDAVSVPLVDDANNKIVTIWRGDITQLEIDAIVNAANSTLMGGGGVDGAIHRAAGPFLKEECATLNGCKTGEAKITAGYRLPAKHVIHTVGPRGEKPDLLRQCYNNSLDALVRNNLRSIAFPCISTGIYGYPQDRAAHVALQTVRSFLDSNRSKIDKIIFTLFLPDDVEIYETLMQLYFPIAA